MLPKINGKSFLECTEDDLKNLLDNPEFRENEYNHNEKAKEIFADVFSEV